MNRNPAVQPTKLSTQRASVTAVDLDAGTAQVRTTLGKEISLRIDRRVKGSADPEVGDLVTINRVGYTWTLGATLGTSASDSGGGGGTGPAGPPGESAYQEWLDAGHTGTEADFLASLVGPAGAAGTTGATGAAGVKGDKGDTGATGPAGPSGGGGGGSDPGTVALDSFTGATDELLLTAAMSYAAAQTYPPTILFGNRAHLFTTSRTLYDGFRIQGPPGYSNAEKSAVNNTCKVEINISGGGTWLVSSTGTTTFDVYIGQLSFIGHSTQQFMGCTNNGLYCALLRDLSFTSFKSILGSQATKMLLTSSVLDGYWEVNNSYNGAFHLGGAETVFWPSGMLLDSGTGFNSAGSAAGQFHLWFDFMMRSSVGPLVITCEGNWGGVKVSGSAYNSSASSNPGGPLWFHGTEIEGRNSGAPCNGANVRLEGGQTIFRDCAISNGMASPSSMGHSPTDAGVVHITSGAVLLDGVTYDKATAVAETVPFLYNGGGVARIFNQYSAVLGGVWTGLPRVHTASGTTSATDGTWTAI